MKNKERMNVEKGGVNMFSINYFSKYFSHPDGESTPDKKYQIYRMNLEANYCSFLASSIENSNFWSNEEKEKIKLVMAGEKVSNWYIISKPFSVEEEDIYVIYTTIDLLGHMPFSINKRDDDSVNKDIELLRRHYLERDIAFLTKLAKKVEQR